ncbi:hypothetical protein JCM10207_006568 [Rhodosporidiobolus poonsookiae]
MPTFAVDLEKGHRTPLDEKADKESLTGSSASSAADPSCSPWPTPLARWRSKASSAAPTLSTSSSSSFVSVKRLKDLALEDILQNRVSGPTSLRDFELYLVYRTKSAEVLFFEGWFRRYSELWSASKPLHRTEQQEAVLIDAYRLGLAFIDPEAPLELNIGDTVRRDLQERAGSLAADPTAPEPFLPPSSFAPLLAETRPALLSAFANFLRDRAGNAHTPRNLFSQIVGLLIFLAAFVPFLLAVFFGWPRGWRFLSLPLVFWGVGQFTASYRRTCLIIFLAGRGRQLYQYEREEDASAQSTPVLSARPSPKPHQSVDVLAHGNPLTTSMSSTSSSVPSIHFSSFPHTFTLDTVVSPALPCSPAFSGRETLITAAPVAAPSAAAPAAKGERFSSPPLHFFPPSRCAADPTVYFSPAHDMALIKRLSSPAPAFGTRTAKLAQLKDAGTKLVKRELVRTLMLAAGVALVATVAMLVLVLTVPDA